MEPLKSIWDYKDFILSKVSLVGIMKDHGIEVEERPAGDFTHRAYCPFHSGKDGGKERTPSFFASETGSSFYCFGCSQSGSTIDFIRLIEGSPSERVLENLAIKIGLLNGNGEIDEIEKLKIKDIKSVYKKVPTVNSFLFEISESLRNHIKMFDGERFETEFKWMEKIAERADSFILQISYEDYKSADELLSKIKSAINKRIKEKQ